MHMICIGINLSMMVALYKKNESIFFSLQQRLRGGLWGGKQLRTAELPILASFDHWVLQPT